MIIDVRNVSLKIKKNKILDSVNLQCEEGKICVCRLPSGIRLRLLISER